MEMDNEEEFMEEELKRLIEETAKMEMEIQILAK